MMLEENSKKAEVNWMRYQKINKNCKPFEMKVKYNQWILKIKHKSELDETQNLHTNRSLTKIWCHKQIAFKLQAIDSKAETNTIGRQPDNYWFCSMVTKNDIVVAI